MDKTIMPKKDFGKKNDIDKKSPLNTELIEQVISTLRKTFASLNEMDPDSVIQFVERVRSSEKVLKLLPKSFLTNYQGIFEVLSHEATVSNGTPIDLFNLPILSIYSDGVKEEIRMILGEVSKVGKYFEPHAQWANLVEIVSREYTKFMTIDLLNGIENNENLEVLMKKFNRIEPPTAKKSISRTGKVSTADVIISEHKLSSAGRESLRFSSGLRTLDIGYTNKNEPIGFISPGQFIVVMGPTGTGKTSFTYSVTPSFGLDLRNWGLKDALQVVWHTEEESIDKLKGFRMTQGQKYHDLAKNLIIDPVGTSRRRMAETLYDLVIRADEQSRLRNRPITDFLPYICQLDYIQSISESGEDEKTATQNTAEFLLRGVCAWNPEEMAKFSKVDFREYAGMAWPKGMEHHRVAVLGYAQLVKTDNDSLYYKKSKKNNPITDFCLVDEQGEPLWDVKENDLRLFGKNQMRGSGIIAQNAHAIVILHRSVPYNNPSKERSDGRKHIEDTRARILFDKARTGSNIRYAPMRFDIQISGERAQYFDELAERAILSGHLTNYDSSYQEEGDPILPIREVLNPLENYRY